MLHLRSPNGYNSRLYGVKTDTVSDLRKKSSQVQVHVDTPLLRTLGAGEIYALPLYGSITWSGFMQHRLRVL